MPLKVDKALHRAARLMENAELAAAEKIYKDILACFPENSKALRGYQRLKSTDVMTRPEGSTPSPKQMQAVMALCHQGQFTEVLSKLDLLLEVFPDALQCTICRAPQARLWVVTTVRSTALKGHSVSRLMTPVFILISAICKKNRCVGYSNCAV